MDLTNEFIFWKSPQHSLVPVYIIGYLCTSALKQQKCLSASDCLSEAYLQLNGPLGNKL